jgi:hypothetical protein
MAVHAWHTVLLLRWQGMLTYLPNWHVLQAWHVSGFPLLAATSTRYLPVEHEAIWLSLAFVQVVCSLLLPCWTVVQSLQAASTSSNGESVVDAVFRPHAADTYFPAGHDAQRVQRSRCSRNSSVLHEVTKSRSVGKTPQATPRAVVVRALYS